MFSQSKVLLFKFPKIISQFSIISNNASIKTGTSIGHGVIINSLS